MLDEEVNEEVKDSGGRGRVGGVEGALNKDEVFAEMTGCGEI